MKQFLMGIAISVFGPIAIAAAIFLLVIFYITDLKNDRYLVSSV